MAALMGLDVVRRTPPSVSRPVNRKWLAGLQFLVMPGIAWVTPAGTVTSPSSVGTYGYSNYGRDWTPGFAAAAYIGQLAHVSLGNNYTLISLQRAGSGTYQCIIDDDDGSSNRHFQYRINSSNQVEVIPFSGGTAYTTTGATVSAADRLTGFPMAMTQASGGATAVWYRGSKTTGSVTGTPNSGSNPWLGCSKAGGGAFQMQSGLALAAGWNYVMTDDQIRALMANPMQLVD